LLYFAGAILEFRRGLWALVEKGAVEGLMYCSKLAGRVPKRREARVAEKAMKRATAMKITVMERVGARVAVGVLAGTLSIHGRKEWRPVCSGRCDGELR
jgi:hypothetical protein